MASISELFEKYYAKTASPEERKMLLEQLARDEHPEELLTLLQAAWERDDAQAPYFSESESRRILNRILPGKIVALADDQRKKRPAVNSTWLRYAAVFILVAGAATIFYLINRQEVISPNPSFTQVSTIGPGTNRAILTLANGEKIELDSAGKGLIARQQNAQIVKLADGQIAYNYDPKAVLKGELMNTITTPNGGQFQLILPDGSRAWLNAASSITYPSVFNGNRRNIQVSGEVYLEIAANEQQPFTVAVNGVTIDVLGTRFNINAYDNEEAVKTTLIDGAVRVSAQANRQILKPGQQAQLSKGGLITITDDIDLKQVMAWKNGYFDFKNADLPNVMRQIERWYDVKVTYKGKTPPVVFKGKMDRNVQLSDVMLFLAKFGIKTTLEGRNLIISENQ